MMLFIKSNQTMYLQVRKQGIHINVKKIWCNWIKDFSVICSYMYKQENIIMKLATDTISHKKRIKL